MPRLAKKLKVKSSHNIAERVTRIVAITTGIGHVRRT